MKKKLVIVSNIMNNRLQHNSKKKQPQQITLLHFSGWHNIVIPKINKNNILFFSQYLPYILNSFNLKLNCACVKNGVKEILCYNYQRMYERLVNNRP